MEPNRPAPVEIKVTWGFAWALWWRWLLFYIALSVVIYVPLILIFVALGMWNY